MALILKPLRCPHCKQPIDKRLLRQHGLLKTFLQSKPLPCPHCKRGIQYPENADIVQASGLFVAVVLAPVFSVWPMPGLSAQHIFALGIALLIAGSLTQKLVKHTLPETKGSTDSSAAADTEGQ